MDSQKFRDGFIAGAGVLLVELLIFVVSVVAAVFGEFLILLLLVITESIKCLIIGFVAPKEYAIGFLAGDLFMLVATGIVIYAVLPTVVGGMIIAFLIVFAALIIRIMYEGEQQRYTEAW